MSLTFHHSDNMFLSVFQGRVMYEIGVETVGQGALKLTGFLKELMQRRNISCESLYTVRTIKEVKIVYSEIVSYLEYRRSFKNLT